MFNEKLKFKVLVSHRSGAVSALEGPKDVTKYTVRVGCDRLDVVKIWRVSGHKMRQQRSHC